MKNEIKVNNIIKQLFVLIAAVFTVVNTNFLGNFSYLDIALLVVTIYYSITTRSIVVKKRTYKVMVVLNTFLFLSFLTLLFVNVKLQSFLFLAQVVFAFNFIPLFIDRLINLEIYTLYLKRIHQLLYLVGCLFIIYAVLHFNYNQGEWLFFTLRGNHRMVWGDGFVGNDLTQFMVLGFMLNELFVVNKKKRAIMSVVLFLIFLITLSRTVLLVGVLYFLFRYAKQALLVGVISLFIGIGIVSSSIANDTTKSKYRVNRLFEINKKGSEKGGRLKSYSDAISSTTHFILKPLYGQNENLENGLKEDSIHKISSVHNVILSILVNFGFFPFMFLITTVMTSLMLLIVKRKYYDFSFFIVFFVLLVVVISLNAFMLSRALWLPLFIVFSFLDKKIRAKNFTHLVT